MATLKSAEVWAAVGSLPIRYLLVSSLLSYIFFVGFVKFYRRYSLWVLMALTAVYKSEKPS